MNLSHTKIVRKLRHGLLHTPLYHPTRYLFNKLFLFRARRTATIGNLALTFWTPTFKLIDDIEQLQERDLLQEFLDALHSGDVVWDVGANIGLYALFAARCVGSQGKVVAFEPEPQTRTLLCRNSELNHLENVTVEAYALDKENAVKLLYRSATANPGTHSLVQRRDYKLRRKGITVQTVRGDDLIRDHSMAHPNVMKIDVEGSECDVLLGMAGILRSEKLRTLIVEVHPDVLPLFGSNPDDVERLVRLGHFTRIEHRERGGEYHLVCHRV